MKKSFTKQIGVVGVDSGQLLVCDPCYIGGEWKETDDSKDLSHADNKGQFSYGGCCEATLNNKTQGGQLNYTMGHAGAGVVFSSGFGDGCYPVIAHYKDYGHEGHPDMRIRKIEITMIHDEKEVVMFDKLLKESKKNPVC